MKPFGETKVSLQGPKISTYSKVGGVAPVQVGTLSPLIYGFLKYFLQDFGGFGGIPPSTVCMCF